MIDGAGAGTMPGDVAAAFEAFPTAARPTLLAIRRLILATAASMPEVGAVTEALRWGEPAYLTLASQSGSTIRLGMTRDGQCAVLFNCRTTLVATFREHFSGELAFDGNRAVLVPPGDPLAEAALRQCVALALVYHRRKRTGP